MRLVWKFATMLALSIGVQWSLEAGAGEPATWDEARFTAQVFLGYLRGQPADDPELVAAGGRVWDRHRMRAEQTILERQRSNAASPARWAR